MAEMEKVIKALENCAEGEDRDCNRCIYFGEFACQLEIIRDALAMLKEQDEIISELLKVGYPHGYENEEPWIVDYMQLITEVVRKAVHLRNGTE